MNWSQAKERFQHGLELARYHANGVEKGQQDVFAKKPILRPLEKRQLQQKIKIGEQFLASLETIKDSYPEVISEQFLAEFLDSATVAIATWSVHKQQNALFHSKLGNYSNDLQAKLEAFVQLPEDNKFNFQLSLGAGGISLALLGIVTIASGPWGLLAIAVAGLVVSLVLAIVTGYRYCQNSQFVDTQPIINFVQEFDPTPKKVEIVELTEDSSSESCYVPG